MKKKMRHPTKKELELVFQDVSYNNLDTIKKKLKQDSRKFVDIISTGKTTPHFYTGEIIMYTINDIDYSGVVILLTIQDESKKVDMVIKRLGVPMIYDHLEIADNGHSRVIVACDGINGTHYASNSYHIELEDILTGITYNTIDISGIIDRTVNDTITEYINTLDAMDELTEERDEPITIH